MTVATIVLGNKNYSSWSMRGWLALKLTGAPFQEIVVPLRRPDTAERIRLHSPSGRVPVLEAGELAVWDSLAIGEYLAERFPSADLWPHDPTARAMARSISAEMHSGFQALRTAMPMNIRRVPRPLPSVPTEVAADVARIRAIWRGLLARSEGGYLFGGFGLADAMYAPVAMRFRSYAVPLDGPEAAYVEAVGRHPAVAEWVAAAVAEPFSIAEYDAI